MPASGEGGWNMHAGCSLTIAGELELGDSGLHIMEEAATGHYCVRYFRVPVPRLRPSITRTGHVLVPSGVSCPAYRVMGHFLPGIMHASRTHGWRRSSLIEVLKGCH